MHENPHGPLLPQGLSLNMAVDVNVAVFDLDRFAGQTNNPFDYKILLLGPSMEGDDFPTPWPPHLKGRAIDQDPIARQHEGWRWGSEFFRTIWADRQRRVVPCLGIAGECEVALRTRRIDVRAQQGGCHRLSLHLAENREPRDKPCVKNKASRENQDSPLHQAANTTANHGLDHDSLAGRQQAGFSYCSRPRQKVLLGKTRGKNPTTDFSGSAPAFPLVC